MQFLAPQASILLLLSHVVLGCCWHHAHAGATDRCEQPIAAATPCGCAAHQTAHIGGDRQAAEPSHDKDHSPPNRCTDGQCTFLRPDQPAELDDKFSSHFLPFDVASSNVKIAVSHSGQRARPHDPFRDGLPLRRHLLLGVMLI